jgi:phosphopantetheine--protein transferase-like protein
LKHVGNDIVDLASPFTQGKSKDRRFINKILSLSEQSVLKWDYFTDHHLWAYWAAKESAFKVVSKIHADISSSPKKYDVCFDDQEVAHDQWSQKSVLTAMVKTPVQWVNVRLYIHKKWIHCIASSHSIDSIPIIFYEVHRIDHLFKFNYSHASKEESGYVRKKAGLKISEQLSIYPELVIFSKNKGKQTFPEVYVGENKTNIDISFSHDGRFVAYAFSLN